LEFADDRGEGGGVPAFGGSVCRAREDREVGLRGGIFWFGESGGWGKLGFAFGKAKIFEEAEVLVGHMDITVGGGFAGLMFCEERVSKRLGKSRAIRDGETFESNAEGVGKECGS